jgi:hypothetical protein
MLAVLGDSVGQVMSYDVHDGGMLRSLARRYELPASMTTWHQTDGNAVVRAHSCC